MKITESHLRKIIRSTLQEMMGATDGMTAMGTMHDNPLVPMQKEPTGSPSDIVDQILSSYQKGDQVDGYLLSMLKAIVNKGEPSVQQDNTSAAYGIGENKKRRLNRLGVF